VNLNTTESAILDTLQEMGRDVPYADLYAQLGDISEAQVKRVVNKLVHQQAVSWRAGHGKLRLLTAELDGKGRVVRPEHHWDDGSEFAMRSCIRCGVSFPSTHRGHRQCGSCKAGFREGNILDCAPGWEFIAA
jgi:hypothetical protein